LFNKTGIDTGRRHSGKRRRRRDGHGLHLGWPGKRRGLGFLELLLGGSRFYWRYGGDRASSKRCRRRGNTIADLGRFGALGWKWCVR
jgi:hypothetical protein